MPPPLSYAQAAGARRQQQLSSPLTLSGTISTASAGSSSASSPTLGANNIMNPGNVMLETARRRMNGIHLNDKNPDPAHKSNGGHNGRINTKPMETQAVLAEAYIPHQHRELNHWPVTFPMQAGPGPANNANQTNHSGTAMAHHNMIPEPPHHLYKTHLVPYTPMCCCTTTAATTNNKNTTTTAVKANPLPRTTTITASATTTTTTSNNAAAAATADRPNNKNNDGVLHHGFPLRMVPVELYYGLDRTVLSHPPPAPNIAFPPLAPATIMDDDDRKGRTLDEYCSIWERLLVRERQVNLTLFERYSQYNVELRIHLGNSRLDRISIGQAMATSQKYQVPVLASIQIDGIANVNPPLSVGDTVLIRPMKRIRMSVAPPQRPPVPSYPNARPPLVDHTVEIRSTIHSIQRQEGRIFFHWVTGHDFYMRGAVVTHSIGDRFNLRFVPASQSVERTLTALDWCRSHHDSLALVRARKSRAAATATPSSRADATLPEEELLQFLFPTRAPSIPVCPNVRDLIRQQQQQQSPPTTGDNQSSSSSSNNSAAAAAAAFSLHSELYRLNTSQLDFVNMVTARTLHPTVDEIRGPAILTGAAGSGKTGTMILSILCVLQLMQQQSTTASGNGNSTDSKYNENRPCHILVCTPSHTAADVITRRLRKHLGRHELFRLYDASRPIETVPSEILQYCRQSARGGHFELPNSPTELLQFKVIVCTCSDANILYRIGLTNEQLRIRRRCFEGCFRQTCAQSNMDFQLSGHDQPHFTHLFVDEAAQATEPELLIPFSVVLDPHQPGLVNKAEVVLAGDPRQLSPDVYSAEAAAAGLNRPMMERLLQRPIQCLGEGHEHMLGPDLVEMEEWLTYSFQKDGQEQLSVFLTMNYRCHPAILALPSALFYFDKLRSAGTEKHSSAVESFWCQKLFGIEELSGPVVRPLTAKVDYQHSSNVPDEVVWAKQLSWPIHFCGVEGQDKSMTIRTGIPSTTWSNEAEASKLVDIVVSLIGQGVPSEKIGVMAPFRGQVVLIRKKLRSKGLSAINVGTVEDYQAVERDVTLISLTRSTPSFVDDDVRRRVGVFGQPKRCNVALTRAENLLVVVGSATVMSRDPVWRQFLLFCLRNGLFYGNAGSDKSLLQGWNSSTCRLVNRMDELSTKQQPLGDDGDDPQNRSTTTASDGRGSVVVRNTVVEPIVVGSLERVLRVGSN